MGQSFCYARAADQAEAEEGKAMCVVWSQLEKPLGVLPVRSPACP